MPDEMHTRLIRAEWEIDALKEGYRQQGDRVAELSLRIDSHHKEVLDAIGSLRDDRVRAEGAAEARLMDADMRQRRLKWLSLALAAIGTLIALGWIGEAKAVTVSADLVDVPLRVQYYSRDIHG